MCGRMLTKQRLGAHKDVWQCVLRAVAVHPQRRGGFMLSSGAAVPTQGMMGWKLEVAV